MNQQVNVFDYAGHICESMKKGILLTTKSGEKVNTMTIGWGSVGIEWGRAIFVAYVRVGRHTRQMLDDNGEFTVNIPYGDFDSKILGFCGTKSGRDVDKIAEMGLDLVDSSVVSVRGIRQFPFWSARFFAGSCRIFLCFRSRFSTVTILPVLTVLTPARMRTIILPTMAKLSTPT